LRRGRVGNDGGVMLAVAAAVGRDGRQAIRPKKEAFSRLRASGRKIRRRFYEAV